MKGRLIRWAAAWALASLSLTACMSKEERAARNPNTSGWSAGADVIKIGLISPFTGSYSILGIVQENSLRVEIDRINDAGGIGGARLDLVIRDSAQDPGKAVQATTELAGDSQVKLLIGPSISAFYAVAKGVLEESHKLNCQPGAGSGSFADLKYGFRSQEPTVIAVSKMLAYLRAQKITSLGLVYENDDQGKAVDRQLREESGAHGITYLGFEPSRIDDQSHRAYVQKLARAGAIYVSSNAGGAKTMAAAEEAGYKGLLVGGSGMQNVFFVEAAGDRAVGSVFAAGNVQFNIRDRAAWQPGYRKHVEAVVRRFGLVVGPSSQAKMPKGTAIAADCIVAFEMAANSARTFDADRLVAALERLDVPASESASGNAIRPADHEFYHVEDIHVYRWGKDAEGWFLTDVTR